jgi:hypothetical protein
MKFQPENRSEDVGINGRIILKASERSSVVDYGGDTAG